MRNKQTYHLVALIWLSGILSALSQSSNIDSGCIPLTIKFDAPDLSAYYWDFKDGSSSELKSPEHTYIQPGTFAVQLFEGVGGLLVGELAITVYPKPNINIEVDPTGGCAPLEVNFDGNVQADPGIDILSYQWTFGDGLSSVEEAPTHTYTAMGSYSVSLQIETAPANCRLTELEPDLVTVQSTNSFFRLDRYADCEVPTVLDITQIVPEEDGSTYLWDFGNGDTSIVYDPDSILYTRPGVYTIRLTVTNAAGCSDEYARQVLIGSTLIELNVPDTVCIGLKALFENTSDATFTEWDFGPGVVLGNTTDRLVEVRFDEPGPVSISLTTYTSSACKSDTTFIVFVDQADPTFEIDPDLECTDTIRIDVSANDRDQANYLWNTWDGPFTGGPDESFIWVEPMRDSFYVNQLDTIRVFLTTTTSAGCKDTARNYVLHRAPEAYFRPDKTRGCAPLQVVFNDFSTSVQPIVRWTWLYGDDTSDEFNTRINPTHVFQNPGEYYVRLIIENSHGCIDTSAGVWIYVGEPIQPEYIIDKTEICLGDSIQIEFTNDDPRIDAWHFVSDGHRFDECWESATASHVYDTEPGEFDAFGIVEYNGCYDSSAIQTITVNGAKADLSYMVNCDTPHDVMLWSKSLNADRLEWKLTDTDSSELDSLIWTFTDTGIYTIVLEAEESGSGCPITTDSATVHIVDLKADFTMDTLLCAGAKYILNADTSQGVDEDCSQGYLWWLPGKRPREVGFDTVHHRFPNGPSNVTLITESINGCRDTITKRVHAYDMQPAFEIDKTLICDPATVSFTDVSGADTTITNISWNFGQEGSEVEHTFSGFQVPDTILVTMTITDAIGCMQTVARPILTYAPVSGIEYDKGPNVCVGDPIIFTADDYTLSGSFLNFNWEFESIGNSTQQTNEVVFDASGTYQVVLNFTEDATGCSGTDTVEFNAFLPPEAGFISNFDTLDPICYPEIAVFIDTSFTDGPVTYNWSMGNGFQTSLQNPVTAYGKGTFDVVLIVRSDYGCADTATAQYTLTGPEGTFIASDEIICKDDEITFSLADTSDIGSFTWDFGDGNRVDNVDPVTHIYGFNPPGGSTLVTLVLESGETGCTVEDSMSIRIRETLAQFTMLDSVEYCAGRFRFQDLSLGVDTWSWDFGNGATSMEQDPVALYDSPGTYSVTLLASDSESGCQDEITQDVEVEFKEYVFMPNVFTPNGDAINDYFTPVVLPGYEEYIEVKQFRIYNRWGNLMYDNEQPEDGWDGTDHGADAPATVYAYAIEVELLDCTTLTFQGNVTLVR